MRKTHCALITLLSFALLTPALQADVPRSTHVQGRLADNSGNPPTAGPKDFTFKIFDQQSGGVEVWPAGPGETQTLATDADGNWNAAVGALVGLTAAVFADSSRWLQVTVDDGVLPPETLPRIKLSSSPYAFSTATIEGKSWSDLRAQFVDETGDTMTGVLLIDAPHKEADGASLRVNNISDGYLPANWPSNTIAVMGNAAATGLTSRIGTLGISVGNDGEIVGAMGETHATGGWSVAVYGSSFAAGAAENYSGLFSGGDFVVQLPHTPGDSSVRLPQDAISSVEILDEPGIAYSRQQNVLPLANSATSQDIVSATITTPSAGYIVLDGVGYFRCENTGSQFGWVQISETSNRARENGHFHWVNARDYANVSTSYTFQSIPVKRLYFKNAGTYTFYLQGNAWESNSTAGDVIIWPPSWLQATYYPVAYGTASALAEEPGDFEATTRVAVEDPLSGETTTGYLVDLRELELRAARKRALAEKAEREVWEARAKRLHSRPREAQGARP